MHRLYVIASNRGGVKIGVSIDPAKRAATLMMQTADTLTLMFQTAPRPDARQVERLAHRLLSDAGIRGEWFDVSTERAQAEILRAIHMIETGTAPPKPPAPPKPYVYRPQPTGAARVKRSRDRKHAAGITRVEVQVYADQAEAIRAYAAKLREERERSLPVTPKGLFGNT